jgi:RimJ/RimL family protein N-acetyltransferase
VLKDLTIETERLILRMFREDDFDEYATLCARPEVMRFIGGKTFTRVEAWRHMAMLVGHWQLRGVGYFAVEDRASRRFIGRIGFTDFADWPGFELGWTIAPEYQGKGLATEGARRLLRYAFEDLDRPHVISLIHRDNEPSIRVAARLGEKLEGETEVLGIPVQIYGIDRAEAERRNDR